MRPLVVLPTYNERSTLPLVARGVLEECPSAEILVVDDGSPDGTGHWAKQEAAREPRLHALHRPRKAGLGSAYKLGFEWGLERGFDPLLEMDADTSHHPHYLPEFLRELNAGAGLVIGSRLIPGGGFENWPLHRRFLSSGSNAITHAMLGMPVKDATSGYRAYRASVLQAVDLHTIEAEGYAFQVEMAFRVWKAGFDVVETPIVFTDRVSGESKISRMEIVQAVRTLARLWWADRHGRIPVPRTAEVYP